MRKFATLGAALTPAQQRGIRGGIMAEEPGEPTCPGCCGSYIDGQWYAIWPLYEGDTTKKYAIANLTNGSGATRWCCDSCPWNRA